MRSLTFKMVIAFLGIALVSIALIVLFSRWNTNAEFSRYISDRRGEEVTIALGNYYQSTGSWSGLQRFVRNNPHYQDFRNPRFTLADANGMVVFAGPEGHLFGTYVPKEELEHGLPVDVNGEIVGTLIFGRFPLENNPLEREFIRRTNRMMLFSALGASLVALLIGIFLSRTLTRPIRELTEATHAVAKGELGAQVSVRSKDELGELAASFNRMSLDLARSTEARKQMTADVAHELRTTLSLIIGHADAVHDGVLPPSRENSEIIRDEALRLDHLVEDLRMLSLADAGELSINLQEVLVQKLLSDVHTTYQQIAAQKKVTLNLNVAPEIQTLKVDPGRMTQVLTNILDNALRHTPGGGQIDLSVRNVEAGVEISIKDSGPGIQEEDINRIFTRFYRADEARSRDRGGSGLGLAIARSFVQAQAGEIWAESEPGQGLTITIKLPIQ